MRSTIAVVALFVVAVACGGVSEGGTGLSASPARPASQESSATTVDTGDIAGFEVVSVVVGGEVWAVALADDQALRSRGLMGVTDMGDVKGMLFAWPAAQSLAFWMKDTLIPLDIAFFAADGAEVTVMSMTPCERDPCPVYQPDRPARWALETVVGGFDGLARPLRLEAPPQAGS